MVMVHLRCEVRPGTLRGRLYARSFYHRQFERHWNAPLSSRSLIRRRAATKLPLFLLLDFCDRVLSVDVLRVELNLVARLNLLQHGWVVGLEDHRHALLHIELLDRAVSDGDLAC